MKQPVILQVLPRLRSGGVERGTIEIAGAVKRAGWLPLVASEGGQMVASLEQAGGEHITLPLASKNPLRIWQNATALENILRTRNVSIIHARSRAPAWSAYLAAKRTGTPFVTTFHGVYGLTPAFKRYYNEVMVKGDRVIAISHFVAAHIAQHYSLDPSRLRIIHRGVDLNQFNPARINPVYVSELKSQWHMPDNLSLILMPARITRWKGQHLLVEALAALPHRNFFCVLLGDDAGHPGYRREVEQLIRARGLEGQIRFAGNTPHMAEAYMLADIVAAPSIDTEAFGRVPVEAQAMGRLVIASDHGGACETIIDGKTGWRVTPGDAQALSHTIDKVLQLPKDQKRRIGADAMKHVRENFSAEVMCARTLEVYRELLDN